MTRRPRNGRSFSLARSLRVLRCLYAGRLRGVTMEEIQDRVGVIRRTLYRDLAAIREAGWRIDQKRDGRCQRFFLVSDGTPWI